MCVGWADAAGITPKKVHLVSCDHPAFRVLVDVGHTPGALAH